MPLSARTIEELKAGAQTVAAHMGCGGVDQEYMDAMIRTQQRGHWLKSLEKQGQIRIEREARSLTSQKHLESRTVVWVGQERFDDITAEMTGAWPSEVLVARVALALQGGQHLNTDGGYG